ncbi:MAG: WHG domain-containing protein [Deltaproteobacteria bacterium]|nr:WHG domain-containing protein [Deltaproteobacteria bacterium]
MAAQRAPRRSSAPAARRARSSTLPPSRRAGYHHGALPRALLDAALVLLEQHGESGFTLRSAAREAGVSPGAPYHHFEDRDALLAALAAEGFLLLSAALDAASAPTDEPPRGEEPRAPRRSAREEAEELGLAYVRFAVERPVLFRLMMGRVTRRALSEGDVGRVARGAFERLRDAVLRAARERAPGAAPAPEEIPLAWSVVHGLAFLAMDGHLGGEPARFEDLAPMVRRTLRLVGDGRGPPE